MFDKSNTYVLERFDTSAGNPVKEILLKLNLPDHRILKDGHGALKSKNFKEVSVTLITEHFSRSDEVLKLKNFKKDASLKLSSYQIKKDPRKVCLKCDLLLDDWIVDSGCTKHMTGNRRLFTSYKAYDGGHVVFGRNLKVKVVGGGNITHDSITITNVEHVSGLAFN
ncbi:hypothetical protein Tco_1459196 [Tanacetum coccineum]